MISIAIRAEQPVLKFVAATVLSLAFMSVPAVGHGRTTSVNKIVGTWAPQSIQAQVNGRTVDLYGPSPTGSLIFTDNMRFSVVISDPRVPPFASDDRSKATPAEKLAAFASLSLYGSYSVGADGQFFDQIVEGASFPNWNGIRRGREQLRLDAKGDTMIEQFANLPDGPAVTIVWRRVH